jgi:tetratricopeptide (TPR) repeat protein
MSAERIARAVLAEDPELPAALGMLARAVLQLDRMDEAEALYRRLVALQPERGEWPRMLVRVLSEANRLDEAEDLCRKIIATGEVEARVHMVHGDLLRALGQSAEADAGFRAALEVEPWHGRALWSLTRNAREEDRRQLMLAAGSALRTSNAGPQHQALASFALGELSHAEGRFDEAFDYFSRGNARLAALQPFDPGAFRRQVAAAIERLGESEPQDAHSSVAPIFILGMPRSGSTLLERMLACHSKVETLGELPTLERLAMAGLVEEYAQRTAPRRHEETSCFIDKMHLNWRFLPEILAQVPQARIVDIRRDPMDCCWSNFRFPFDRGHPAANDLAWLAMFYRGYDAVLDSASDKYPDRVVRIGYEALVDNPESELRGLLEFLGLEFESACLDFHTSTAPVATASSEQVRQPLNRRGIGVHKPYLEHLGPLQRALKP